MGKHLVAMGIMFVGTILAAIVGIVVAVNGTWVSGLVVSAIIAGVCWIVGFVLAALNMRRLWNNPDQMLPRGWR